MSAAGFERLRRIVANTGLLEGPLYVQRHSLTTTRWTSTAAHQPFLSAAAPTDFIPTRRTLFRLVISP